MPSAVVTSAVPCIDLDATVAPIVQNYFDFMEPNNTPAGGTGVKVQVSSAQASGFNGNIIRVVDAHGGNVGVAIGTSSTGADRITGNTWTINTDPRTGGTGLETYGYNDYINISVTNLEGSPTKGVRILGNSAGNTINILRNNASTPFEGPSNLNNAIINGVDAASAYISGQSNQSIPSGGTWQKINFNAKEFDTQGNYSTSNSSFVVVLAGVYRVNSQISYVDVNDTGIMQIAVYRNSDRIKVHNTNASGLPAGYPSISVSSII